MVGAKVGESAMSKLHVLRSRLRRLAWRRWGMRWSAGFSAFLSVLLALAVFFFLLDWSLWMDRPQRAVAWLLVLGGIVVAWRRYVQPLMGYHENEIDMALLVERQQKIDSDLVAALQFESIHATQWGSAPLRQAVVDYVADFSKGLNVFEGLDTRLWRQRVLVLSLMLSCLVPLVLAFADFWAVFAQRAFFGSQHYPTRTRLVALVIHDQPILLRDNYQPDTAARAPFGQPLRFFVQAGGEIPAGGQIHLRAAGSESATLNLLPVEEPEATLPATIQSIANSEDVSTTWFYAELPRLLYPLEYHLTLGDAYTDPGHIAVIPLPVVELEIIPVMPAYAIDKSLSPSQRDPWITGIGMRQVTVLEGAGANLILRAGNKPLRSVTMVHEQKEYPLIADDESRRVWRLEEQQGPLQSLVGDTRFRVVVVDDDGLAPDPPVEGMLRVTPDRRPRASLAVATQVVLPVAKPSLVFGAADDFGVARANLQVQVSRPGAATRSTQIAVALPEARAPMVQGKHALDLAPLEVAMGDQVRVVLEVTDFRGDRAGRTAASDPVTLTVTDERGVLAALMQADQKSAQALDAIIHRQLGIGGDSK